MKAEAAKYGIENQIIFTEKLPRDEYLKYAPEMCDLYLDTEPCNAHTTAVEMLTGGLPLLTITGNTRCGRIAASVLESCGLKELVANDLKTYEELAVRLASTEEGKTQLAKTRKLLHAAKSSQLQGLGKQDVRERAAAAASASADSILPPFFDLFKYTRSIEAAFEMIHSRSSRGLPAADIVITDSDIESTISRLPLAKSSATHEEL